MALASSGASRLANTSLNGPDISCEILPSTCTNRKSLLRNIHESLNFWIEYIALTPSSINPVSNRLKGLEPSLYHNSMLSGPKRCISLLPTFKAVRLSGSASAEKKSRAAHARMSVLLENCHRSYSQWHSNGHDRWKYEHRFHGRCRCSDSG